MKTISEKLQKLQKKIDATDESVKIMIIGLGSVGVYLLDYLISIADPRIELIVVGRNRDKMQLDVNIVKTAATIRRQLKSRIHIDTCDLNNTKSIEDALAKWNPDFLVNSSRVYSGLKYGSISWNNVRAYGIWTPLSVKFAKNIMIAYRNCNCDAISINTSYSDAVIPWLKSAGLDYFDFGSGNLNHLIPRMKFYIAEKYGIEDLNSIDVTLAVSHFHDVVISKEGQPEGQDILLDIKYNGENIDFDKKELLSSCSIPMPTDQKRNMMNASSNFDIINSIITAIRNHSRIKIHTPGVEGMIGGYPYVIDATSKAKGYLDESVFSKEQMEKANRESLYLDGIENVHDGILTYTDELIAKVKKAFGVNLPKYIDMHHQEETAQYIIKEIIEPNT